MVLVGGCGELRDFSGWWCVFMNGLVILVGIFG